jgi:ribosome-binding protein aMBF1 (putative translation factor)
MSEDKETDEIVVPDTSGIRVCLSCGQEFQSKHKTNRICNRPQCRKKRSKPPMYVEANGLVNKPDPNGKIVFP